MIHIELAHIYIPVRIPHNGVKQRIYRQKNTSQHKMFTPTAACAVEPWWFTLKAQR